MYTLKIQKSKLDKTIVGSYAFAGQSEMKAVATLFSGVGMNQMREIVGANDGVVFMVASDDSQPTIAADFLNTLVSIDSEKFNKISDPQNAFAMTV